MRIFLVRHAEAEAKIESKPDADRALTDLGREQARSLASAFSARGLEVGAIVTSPYVRTHQTAVELAEVLKPSLPEVIDSKLLTPGKLRPKKLSRTLADLAVESVAVVGHMPELGEYAEWLIGARAGSMPLAKAAAVCLEFDKEPAKADGELLWLVTPEWFQSPVKAAVTADA